MGCECAKYDGDEGRYICEVSGDGCMYMRPDSKKCAEQWGEGPDAPNFTDDFFKNTYYEKNSISTQIRELLVDENIFSIQLRDSDNILYVSNEGDNRRKILFMLFSSREEKDVINNTHIDITSEGWVNELKEFLLSASINKEKDDE